MADPPSRSNQRLLAPVALGVVTLLFIVLVIISAGGGGGDEGPAPASDTTPTKTTTAKKPVAKKPQPATYTVKTGDNLGSIAQKTKVPIEKLQELNPDLDPQAMVTGQKIKLRE
jgi:LysM repeat protein